MLLPNLISALQDGTSGNLLARVFSFAGTAVEQPWLEAYALANALTLALFFSLATRALLRDALAIRRASASINRSTLERYPLFPTAPASLPSSSPERAAPPLTVRFTHSRKVATTGA